MKTRGAIVVVEDDEDDVFLTTHVLARVGVSQDIVVARDGRAALDLLLPSPHPPVPAVLVLLDLQLPHVGGLEVLRRLRADPRTAALPVIVFINSRTDEDHLSSYPQPTGFTRKPLTVRAFQTVSTGLGLPDWS